jgi:hypothetical protein
MSPDDHPSAAPRPFADLELEVYMTEAGKTGMITAVYDKNDQELRA